jgi:hypothetical protein
MGLTETNMKLSVKGVFMDKRVRNEYEIVRERRVHGQTSEKRI